jgi:phosphohistidine phosphatase
MTRNSSATSGQKAQAPFGLYLMRHGAAVTRGPGSFARDFQCPLTLEGGKDLLQIAKGLKRLGVSLDWIVTSPVVRALETAEIMRGAFGSGVPLSSFDNLRPGGAGEGLLDFLARHPRRRCVLVIGHEPDLSKLAARLLGATPSANLRLKKGGCCLIILDGFPPKLSGRLAWWLPPRVLRKLA